MKRSLLSLLWLVFASAAIAQGDARLWLRFPQPAEQTPPATIAVVGDSLLSPTDQSIVRTAEAELRQHWLAGPVLLQIIGEAQPKGAFTVEKSAQGSIRVSAASSAGLLHGVYFILRSQAMGDGCLCATLGAEEKLTQQPAAPLRPLFLADDLLQISRRGLLTDFARACASLGTDAIVTAQPESPSAALGRSQRLKAVADSLQCYGLRLLLPTDSLVRQLTGAAGEGGVAQPFLTASLLDRWRWYAAGRRAWSPAVTPEQVAFEWLAQTFTENPLFIMPMREKLLDPAADPASLEQQLQEAARRY